VSSEAVTGSARSITPKALDTIVSVRFPHALFAALAAHAADRGCSVSALIRDTVRRVVEQPCGYRCEHVTFTFPPGLIWPPHLQCACEPQPLYADEVRALVARSDVSP
jgi:hypothetical protein